MCFVDFGAINIGQKQLSDISYNMIAKNSGDINSKIIYFWGDKIS